MSGLLGQPPAKARAYHRGMVDLFAGFPVADYLPALQWYRQLLGSEPSFYPNDREAVWEVGEHCFVYFEVLPDRAAARSTW